MGDEKVFAADWSWRLFCFTVQASESRLRSAKPASVLVDLANNSWTDGPWPTETSWTFFTSQKRISWRYMEIQSGKWKKMDENGTWNQPKKERSAICSPLTRLLRIRTASQCRSHRRTGWKLPSFSPEARQAQFSAFPLVLREFGSHGLGKNTPKMGERKRFCNSRPSVEMTWNNYLQTQIKHIKKKKHNIVYNDMSIWIREVSDNPRK